jgi:hypothetical protein
MSRSHAVAAATRLAVFVLTALLIFSPMAVLAAPVNQFGTGSQGTAAEQGTTAEPLLLGQYANVALASGESIRYELVIPESGPYLITAVDDEAAADFNLVITDGEGTEIYNDLFATTELTLETGTITLSFTATAGNLLFFVLLGQIGGMSSDENQPGKLLPGSIYIEENISDTRYATLSVPETTYPQQVLIVLQTDEEDVFYAYAEGENVYASTTSDTNNIMNFWTQGGDYTIQVDPYERRSALSLIVFLSGRPAILTLDAPIEGQVSTGATEVVYELQLDANYTDLELAVESDEDLGITLLDTYYESTVYHSSYGEEDLVIDTLYPGVYYVLVQAPQMAEEDIPFSLSITGEAGRPTTMLETDVAFDDEFADNEHSINYSFEVVNPGALITVSLSGADEDTDFDINAGLRPGSNNWSSYSYGSDETLTFVAPVAGIYYVTVVSNDSEGVFTIQANEGEVAHTLESDAVFYDLVEGSSTNIYLLPIDEAGQLLTVSLVGPEDVDLDLSVTGYNAQGDSILSLSGYSSGSVEVASYVVSEAGLYQVSVSAAYSDEGGYFFIEAQVSDPRLFGAQWAVDATASSEFGDSDYAAIQAIGINDSADAVDSPTAWAAAEDDAGTETLELTFDVPVNPYALAIVESFNPGAITLVEAYDADADAWTILYEGGAAPIEETSRVFFPELTSVDFTTSQIRLTLDTAAVPGSNQIDAVQLFGRP